MQQVSTLSGSARLEQDRMGSATTKRLVSTTVCFGGNGHTKGAGVVVGGDAGVQSRRGQLGQSGGRDERALAIHDDDTALGGQLKHMGKQWRAVIRSATARPLILTVTAMPGARQH